MRSAASNHPYAVRLEARTAVTFGVLLIAADAPLLRCVSARETAYRFSTRPDQTRVITGRGR